MAADELDELIDFLADRRANVQLMALEIISGLTGSPEGINKLKSKMDKLLVFMLRLIPVQGSGPVQQVQSAAEISKHTLSSLVNLSQDPDFMAKLTSMHVVNRVTDYIREGSCPHARLMSMLLCNLTVEEAGCEEILQLGKGNMEGLNMAVLLKKFVMSGIDWSEGREDAWEHIALVLMNVTRLRKGRELLLQPGRGLLHALVAQLRSPSELRKRGAAGAIKNCCMSAEADGTLQHLLADEGVLERMLEPINGLDPKERDDTVREAIAESVLVLTQSQAGRDALWKVKAPHVLRKGYELEEHPGVCRAMEHAAEAFLAHGEIDSGAPTIMALQSSSAAAEAEAAAAAAGAEGQAGAGSGGSTGWKTGGGWAKVEAAAEGAGREGGNSNAGQQG